MWLSAPVPAKHPSTAAIELLHPHPTPLLRRWKLIDVKYYFHLSSLCGLTAGMHTFILFFLLFFAGGGFSSTARLIWWQAIQDRKRDTEKEDKEERREKDVIISPWFNYPSLETAPLPLLFLNVRGEDVGSLSLLCPGELMACTTQGTAANRGWPHV